jgi:hypothetical protein
MPSSKRIVMVIVSALAIILPSVAIGAQERSPTSSDVVLRAYQQPVTLNNPLAYVGQDGNVYMTDESSGAGQPVTGDAGGGSTSTAPFHSTKLIYGQFAWSPVGGMLAFTERVNKTASVVESGKAPNVVARGVDSGFPASFSPDGKDLAYVVQTTQQSGPNNQDLVLQIQAVPSTGGAPRALGSLVGTSWACGAGGVFNPSAALYYLEMGTFSDSPMTFVWLKQGYLHSMTCTGRGLALSNGAQDLWQNPNLQNAVLSPDQTSLLAVAYDPSTKTKQLNLVDLANGQLTPISTQPGLDRAVFSGDGKTIIYSTVESSRTAEGDPNSDVGKQLFDPNWPVSGDEYNIVLWAMPVAGGTPTTIYKESGYRVGYITSSPDKPYVAFSRTTSLAPMIDSINAGDPVDKVLGLAPRAEVLTASFAGFAPPATLAQGNQPSFGPAEQFDVLAAAVAAVATPTLAEPPTLVAPPTLVVPPTEVVPPTAVPPVEPTATPYIVLPSGGQCPGFMPSRLVVGGQGIVTPGSSNRLRETPATGRILTEIPPGGIFDVLEGPVCMSNGIAWWRVNYSGTIGWTAEGQGTEYWLEPYTGPAPGGTFGVVGVPASVSPANSSTCPTTFTIHAQIVVNAPGTVTFRWERSDGATSAVGTYTFGAGETTKDLSATWTLSASGTYWQRLHVLTPNDVTSNQATFTLNCGGGVTFAATGAAVAVSPSSSTTCPRTFNFAGTITANAAGTVTYRWERSDGGIGTTHSLTFTGAGTKSVTALSWTLSAAGSRWARIHVLSPNSIYSNQATFTLSCGGGAFSATGASAGVSPSSSTTCPRTFNFAGTITANGAGTVTYRWERSDGGTGTTHSLTFTGAGTKSVTALSWTLSAAGSHWARIHVLSPNSRYSNTATFTLSCGGGGAFSVTAVGIPSVSVTPTCPRTLTFHGTITANGAGTVIYRWERSDGNNSGPLTLTFTGAGTKTVSRAWSGINTSGTRWIRLVTVSPNARSVQRSFGVTCP